jgi:hypothetical protein
MNAEELVEYLDEIRHRVCTRCIERPAGGPPCLPLGKRCGVELHLPELIRCVHESEGPLIERYLEHNRDAICRTCPDLHHDNCRCPMDYLVGLIVEAVETVDARRGLANMAV